MRCGFSDRRNSGSARHQPRNDSDDVDRLEDEPPKEPPTESSVLLEIEGRSRGRQPFWTFLFGFEGVRCSDEPSPEPEDRTDFKMDSIRVHSIGERGEGGGRRQSTETESCARCRSVTSLDFFLFSLYIYIYGIRGEGMIFLKLNYSEQLI